MSHHLIRFVACFAFCYFYFPSWLVDSQMTLPSMVTIPPDSASASGNNSMGTYAMTIYDQACLDQAEPSSNQSSSGNSSSTSGSDDEQISQWVQSQFVVYVGAVALNGNNTCQVICQVQSLTQFAIMFGQDIRTRSVLVGRVYMTSMPDGTSCTADSNNGTCSAGQCGAGEGSPTTTLASNSTEVASNSSETTVAGTTVSGATGVTTTLAPGATTSAAENATTTPAPSG